MPTNVLLTPAMMLAKAMVLVGEAEEGNEKPFEVTADFVFPSSALTYSIDDFTEQYLRTAIADALDCKRALVEWQEFEAGASDQFCSTFAGIAGRFRRYYDISRDEMPAVIDIRAADGPTRREQRRLMEERWEARRRSRAV